MSHTLPPPQPHQSEQTAKSQPQNEADLDRRRFLLQLVSLFGAAGAVFVLGPLLRTMGGPAKAQPQATSYLDVNLADVPLGSYKTYSWQGKPVFVWHRTPQQIALAQAQNSQAVIDPQPDALRVQNPQWLVVVGSCTHLGCVPMAGQGGSAWVCPCHGSKFDLSGRVLNGPADKNLTIPPYRFLDATTMRIG